MTANQDRPRLALRAGSLIESLLVQLAIEVGPDQDIWRAANGQPQQLGFVEMPEDTSRRWDRAEPDRARQCRLCPAKLETLEDEYTMSVSSIAATGRQSSTERRRHPRIPAPHISASPFDGDLDIVNLSRRGMSVLSHHPLSIGGTYLFELWQEGNSLVVEGLVRWSRPQDVANQEEVRKESRHQAGVAFERVRSRERREPWPTGVVLSPVLSRPVDRLAEARKTLAEADSIHVAAEGLLDVLEPVFERLVLLRCQANALRAWMGRGRTLRPLRLQNLELGLDRPSLFLHLREGGSFFQGSLPPMPLHQDLVDSWNGDLEQECVLVPIRIGHRMVTVLYADTGDEAPTREDLDLLRRAGRLLEESMSSLILRRKAESRNLGESQIAP